MEFPDLGKHCSEPTCKQLDFLPLKCDACEQIFCKDHISYAEHSCSSAYKKDVQVPVCPLCNTPIPVKRGETADMVVGEHIDRECKSDPAQQKRKIFTNKCGKPGCKQKEMMKVICDQCHGNFCLKHRHPLDHDCNAEGPSLSKAGYAAMMRAQRSSSKSAVSSSRAASKPAQLAHPQPSQGAAVSLQQQSRAPLTTGLQNGLSEEEALQRALENSLTDPAVASAHTYSRQEEEDFALAQAISASEEEYRRQQHPAQNQNSKASNCILT
ncbi:AN1-type zinc finger protein 2B [Rhinatrema bivittatum]|uniref:AN1-type zinc finger protein 2B n=1 Tax=Rhinatrema bivittatum TaxID=194408 RepID=UPI001127D9BC|nr:AN1-type zinc finger protein 2B [Rhinatrema bivittatum]XP_029460838.1 AN1-type zinc finger protein 2B [Rhinatrema bivittatum]XP_029460839.1 AN1-type zinc finger protein 2B [Rhinatrema bivittatum]XP_029460840.1 AN1-type zinc finger protein 2B [Rhinatrema bivittatum]XP_029460841.1 AN1-type zinc finger protein 2B [Rhinatrema bivittatum]